ncbi:MAG: thermonuclease family protein [Pyrinomonadaceae bacterium]
MQFPRNTFRFGLILATLLLVVGLARAGTLYGTVTEIDDGDTVTIICLNRPLKVRLMGIDAPDNNQAYADVARQHLSDLILNKFVTVQYSSLGAHGLIIGKVFLKEMDVGAQMIRDGVAWFSKDYDTSLTEKEREVYAASEVAARNEQRGIWQDKNPLPPWEFKEAQRRGQLEKASPNPQTSTVAKRSSNSGLTSESLLQSFSGSGDASLSSMASSKNYSGNSDSRWIRLSPPSANFSIMVPSDGTQRSLAVPIADGREADFHIYFGRYEKTAYVVVSSTTPNGNDVSPRLLDGAIKGFIAGIQADWLKLGSTFTCEPTLDREFSVSGYDARQYDLSRCTVPGKIRLYTRVVGGMRELYLNGAFFFGSPDDPNANQFFKSFSINNAKSSPKTQ